MKKDVEIKLVKTHIVKARVDDNQLAKIGRMCKKRGLNFSEWFRMMVDKVRE